MRILITGGAGFIGSNFVNYVVREHGSFDLKLIVLDNLSYAGSKANFSNDAKEEVEFIEGDIRNQELVSACTRGVDAIINFAAESHVDRSINSPRIFFETNVLGTQTLLDSCLLNNVAKFIQISTDEVYGSIENGFWDESYSLSPNSPYSASKAAADLMVKSYANTFGLNAIITRSCNNYGPCQFPEKVVPLFITNLLRGLKLPLYGTGTNIREWLHVYDHCHAIFLALTKGQPFETFNIGSGQELSNLKMAKLILEIFSMSEEWIEFVPDRKGHDLRYAVDFSKARKSLGYQPQIDLKKGLEDTVNWYKENSNWWKQRIKV